MNVSRPHPQHLQEDFEAVVKEHSGFEFVAHKLDAPTFAEQKWSWTGLQPGACTMVASAVCC